jgi:hypothetical protein
MIKKHILVSTLILFLALGSCSNDNDIVKPNSEIEKTQDFELGINNIEIGHRNSQQMVSNTTLPLSTSFELQDKKDKVDKVTLTIKDKDKIIWTKVYTEVDKVFNTDINLADITYDFKEDSTYTLTIEAITQKKLEVKSNHTLTYINFNIEKLQVLTQGPEGELKDLVYLNSTRSTINYTNIDFKGELKHAQYFFEEVGNTDNVFVADLNIHSIKANTPNSHELYISKENMRNYKNELVNIKPGKYNMYLQIQKNDKSSEPILVKENITIEEPLTKYNNKDVVFSSTPNYDNKEDNNKFYYKDNMLTFLIKGLNNVYSKNEGIEIISTRLVEKQQIEKKHIILVNFIYSYKDPSMTLPENQFYGRSKKDIQVYNGYVDILYENGYSEAIYMGEMKKQLD